MRWLALFLHGCRRCYGCPQLIGQLCRLRVDETSVSSWSAGRTEVWPTGSSFDWVRHGDGMRRYSDRWQVIIVSLSCTSHHWTTYHHRRAITVIPMSFCCKTSRERYVMYLLGGHAKMGLVPFRQPATLFCCCHLVPHILCCIVENKSSLFSFSLTFGWYIVN